jgi:hypothetical protein
MGLAHLGQFQIEPTWFLCCVASYSVVFVHLWIVFFSDADDIGCRKKMVAMLGFVVCECIVVERIGHILSITMR